MRIRIIPTAASIHCTYDIIYICIYEYRCIAYNNVWEFLVGARKEGLEKLIMLWRVKTVYYIYIYRKRVGGTLSKRRANRNIIIIIKTHACTYIILYGKKSEEETRAHARTMVAKIYK